MSPHKVQPTHADLTRARQLLHISPSATAREITTAYRRASLRAHPDKGGTQEAFQAVTDAYALLTQGLRRPPMPATPTPSPQPDAPRGQRRGAQQTDTRPPPSPPPSARSPRSHPRTASPNQPAETPSIFQHQLTHELAKLIATKVHLILQTIGGGALSAKEKSTIERQMNKLLWRVADDQQSVANFFNLASAKVRSESDYFVGHWWNKNLRKEKSEILSLLSVWLREMT